MGLYTSYFSAIPGLSLADKKIEKISQSAPTIADKLCIVTGTTTETRTNGMARIALLGDFEQIQMAYRLDDDMNPLRGFIVAGRQSVATEPYNELVVSDQTAGVVDLFNDGVKVDELTDNIAGLVIVGMATVIAGKLTNHGARQNPDIQALLSL